MKALNKVFDILCKVIRVVCMLLLGCMVLLMFYQIIMRYIFHHAPGWCLELTLIMFMWITFFGTALCARKMSHVSMTLVLNKMPAGGKRVMSFIALLFVAALAMILIIAGFNQLIPSLSRKSDSMGISMGWTYASLPVGCCITFLFTMENIVRYITGFFVKKQETVETGAMDA